MLEFFPDGKSLITLTESEWEKVRPSTSKIPDLRIHAVSFARCHSKVEAINRVATAARAPEYFGENLDALCDILLDHPPGLISLSFVMPTSSTRSSAQAS